MFLAPPRVADRNEIVAHWMQAQIQNPAQLPVVADFTAMDFYQGHRVQPFAHVHGMTRAPPPAGRVSGPRQCAGSHCMSGRPIGLHLIKSRCGRGFAHDRLPRKIPGSRHRRLRATARMPRSSDLDVQEANVDDDDDQVLTIDACKINFHGARCRQLVGALHRS